MCCVCGAFKITHLVPYLSNRHYRWAGPKTSLHVLGSEDYLASSGSFTPTKSPHNNEWTYITNSGTYPKEIYVKPSPVSYTPPFIIRAHSHPRTLHHRLSSTPRPPTIFSAANVHFHKQNISRHFHFITRAIFWIIFFSF